MLIEQRITENGIEIVDKVQLAINRIIGFKDIAMQKSPLGYYVGVSGGKDSTVLEYLFWLAKQQCPELRYELHHNHTTMDAPATVYFVKRMQAYWQSLGVPYIIHKPTYKGEPTSIYKMIAVKGVPTLFRRWCCELFKEGGGKGRCCSFGVRWQESIKRKNRGIYEVIAREKINRVIRNNDNDETRQFFETCQKYDKYALNPIIDWSDYEVWEFIHKYKLKYNPLYDMGYTRVGCVGCPLSSKAKQEFEKYPKYKANYIRACQKFINNHEETAKRMNWKNGQEMFDWWVNYGNRKSCKNQTTFDDLMEEFEE